MPNPIKKALLHPGLKPDNFSPYTLGLVIHVQQSDTAPRLSSTIRSTPRIKEQLPIVLLVVGDMAMPKHNNTSIREFLASQTHTCGGIAQNMHNPDPTMTHHYLAFDRQLQYDLFIFNVALNMQEVCMYRSLVL